MGDVPSHAFPYIDLTFVSLLLPSRGLPTRERRANRWEAVILVFDTSVLFHFPWAFEIYFAGDRMQSQNVYPFEMLEYKIIFPSTSILGLIK